MHFVVLSSSRGTTFQSIIDRMTDGSLSMPCLGLVTDRADRQCIDKANAADIPVAVVPAQPKPDREAFDQAVQESIATLAHDQNVDLSDVIIAEMGWMWIHTPWFIAQWPNRILNVHPALLPRHGGKGMYGHHVHDAVLAAGDTESGVSIHIMDSGVDTGTILVQKKCSVEPNDTAETLQARVQELEKEWYTKALEMIQEVEITL